MRPDVCRGTIASFLALSLSLNGQHSGFYQDRSGTMVAFHATPGYETYRGLGWYGVIVCAA